MIEMVDQPECHTPSDQHEQDLKQGVAKDKIDLDTPLPGNEIYFLLFYLNLLSFISCCLWDRALKALPVGIRSKRFASCLLCARFSLSLIGFALDRDGEEERLLCS